MKERGLLKYVGMDGRRRNLTDIGWKGVNWFHLPQDGGKWQATVDMVMCLWVP